MLLLLLSFFILCFLDCADKRVEITTYTEQRGKRLYKKSPVPAVDTVPTPHTNVTWPLYAYKAAILHEQQQLEIHKIKKQVEHTETRKGLGDPYDRAILHHAAV